MEIKGKFEAEQKEKVLKELKIYSKAFNDSFERELDYQIVDEESTYEINFNDRINIRLNSHDDYWEWVVSSIEYSWDGDYCEHRCKDYYELEVLSFNKFNMALWEMVEHMVMLDFSDCLYGAAYAIDEEILENHEL